MNHPIINIFNMKLPADIRTLQAFVTVAREGNVSRAADKLNRTQPAVSLQIKRLASDTGLILFRRTAKGVELTRDGAALLVKAEHVLSALSDFGQTARRMTGMVRGTLRIGTIVDPDFIRLGQFLKAIADAAPELQTQLVHGMSGDVTERLRRGEIDCGFVLCGTEEEEFSIGRESENQTEHFWHRELTRFRYRVIAPAGWENRVHGLDWGALATLPWIGTPPASIHNKLLTRIFRRLDTVQNKVALVDQEPSMLAMVRSGVGLCLCRESIALHEKQTNGIVIADCVEVEAALGFLTKEKRLAEPSMAVVADVLTDLWPLPLQKR